MKKVKYRKTKIRWWIYSIIALVLIGSFFLINFCFCSHLKIDDEKYFNVSLCTVDAIFSGLAFAGIIISITLQSRKELSEIKQYFKRTKTFKTAFTTISNIFLYLTKHGGKKRSNNVDTSSCKFKEDSFGAHKYKFKDKDGIQKIDSIMEDVDVNKNLVILFTLLTNYFN